MPSRDEIFVGRAEELSRLNELAVKAADGRTSAGIVLAEPGLGKTRLLGEVCRGLQSPRVDMRGYELAREVPLGTAAGLLRALSKTGSSGHLLESLLLGTGRRERGLGKLRLFEVALRCVADFGELVVCVDDVQWADGESLSLLQYVLAAANTDELPLLVLCGSRPAPHVSAFASDLGRLMEPECFAEFTLGPLDQLSGMELARSLDPQMGAAEAEGLWRRAGGSPFWVEALAGRDRADATPSQLVRARVGSLDAGASALFALLVTAAEPLRLPEVAQVLGWPEDRVRRAATILANRGLAVQDGGVIRVAHDLIREAAAAELPDAERRRLHGLLASWLQVRAGDDVRQLFRALEHAQAAGAPVVELAQRIARSPQRRLVGRDGLTALGAVADSSADGTALQRDVASLASELGDWAAALERWTALSDRLSSAEARAVACVAAAAAAFRLGRAGDVHQLVARARESAGDNRVLAIEADALEVQALLWLDNEVVKAQPIVERTVAAAQRLVERAGELDALDEASCDAYVRAMRGKLDAAIRSADAATVARCVDLIQTAARDPAEALAAASDGVFSMLQFEGLPRSAEPRAHRLLEEARQRILPSVEVEATHWVGWIAHHLGRLDEAADMLRQALTLAARVGPPRRFTIAQLRAVACSIEASRSDWRGNVAEIERAIAAEPDQHFRLVIRLLHIWLVGRFAAPKPTQLTPLLQAMSDDAERAGCGRCLWESVLHAAEAQARIGDLAGARGALERWDATHPNPYGGPGARRAYVGALLEMHREPEHSLPLFAQAAMDASAVGYELVRLWIELDAAIAASRVDRDRGVDQLRQVAHNASAIGAFSEHQLAVHELRTLGVRTWRRSGDTAPLTARELEIAELVADGQSNPEIASTLFLSRKTVERHVSNILTKTGARNRTELAKRLPSGNEPGRDG